MKNWPLLRSLHGRGLNAARLALLINSSRSHVSQTLANDPGRGGQTRRKLAPLLTPDELAAARWDAQGNPLSAVPQGTKSQAEPKQIPGPCDGPATPPTKQ